ncbi:MAG: hypothetical protein J0H41_12695 [Rhizobiales bacterium]|nr:hypothetical protein [Hyphomicrobiales bacterium]
MAWRPYASCCHREALSTDSAFCPECGRTLIRCMAFSECFSLVAPMQHCPVCIAPELAIEKGAMLQSRVGERLSIPLVLRNVSTVERPIWVTGIVKAESGAHEPIELTWERLDAKGERGFTLTTAPFAQAGAQSIGVIATIASRHKGREERYAFAGVVPVVVEAPEQQVVQNINLSGAQFATGGMVHAPVSGRAASTAPIATRDRQAIHFERAERYELERGVRGYADMNARAPRDVSFSFTGFAEGEAPPDGRQVGVSGALSCGRNGRMFDAEKNPFPNDLCLRARDPRTGAVDEDATRALSRHHFDFLVLNDRLHVQTRSNGGLELNGRRLASGDVEVVRNGDRIAPLPGHGDKLTLTVSLRSSVGVIEAVQIAREPRAR